MKGTILGSPVFGNPQMDKLERLFRAMVSQGDGFSALERLWALRAGTGENWETDKGFRI